MTMGIKKIIATIKGRTTHNPAPAADAPPAKPIRRINSKKAVLQRTGADQLDHARQHDRAPARTKKIHLGDEQHHPARVAHQSDANSRLQRREATRDLPRKLDPAVRPKGKPVAAVAPDGQRIVNTKPAVAPPARTAPDSALAQLDQLVAEFGLLEDKASAEKSLHPTATPGPAAQQIERELEAVLANLVEYPVAKEAEKKPGAPSKNTDTFSHSQDVERNKIQQQLVVQQQLIDQNYPLYAAQILAKDAVDSAHQNVEQPRAKPVPPDQRVKPAQVKADQAAANQAKVDDEIEDLMAQLAAAAPVQRPKPSSQASGPATPPSRSVATQNVLDKLNQKKKDEQRNLIQGYLDQGWREDAAKRFASEAIGTSAQKNDKPTLQCYDILRKGGLDADRALAAASTALANMGGKPVTDVTNAFLAEAKVNPVLQYDTERIEVYCAARLLGHSTARAQSIAKMGPFYLQAEQAGTVDNVRALLDEYRVSYSPLSFPRIVASVPQASMKILGSGTFNTVSSLTLNGEAYAFKPFLSNQELHDAQAAAKKWGTDAPDRVSLAGELAAVDENRHFPELRHIAVVRAAKALGLDGPEGVIGDAVVAIINGKPGLLMTLAPGERANQTYYYDDYLTPVRGPEEEKVFKLVTKHAAQLQDPVCAAATRKMLGIHSVRFGPYGAIYLTGTGASRDPARDQQKFESPSYRKAMANVQLLTFIMNQADLHLGNLLVEPPANPDEKWRLKIIDADDAGGKRDARYWGDTAKESYLLVNQPKYLSAESVATMGTKSFEARMKNLDDDLAGDFSQEERKAIKERTAAVRESVKTKAAKVPVDDAEWASKKLINPANSMTAKFRGIKLET